MNNNLELLERLKVNSSNEKIDLKEQFFNHPHH